MPNPAASPPSPTTGITFDPQTGMIVMPSDPNPDSHTREGWNPQDTETMIRGILNPELAGAAGFLAGGAGGAGLLAGGTRMVRDRLLGQPQDPIGIGQDVALNSAPGMAGELLERAGPMFKTIGSSVVDTISNLLTKGRAPAARAAAAGAGDVLEGTRIGGGVFRHGVEAAAPEGQEMMLRKSVDLENQGLAGNMKPTVGPPPVLSQKLDAIVDAMRQSKPIPADAVRTLQTAGLNPKQINELVSRRIGAAGNATLAIDSELENYLDRGKVRQ